MNNTLHFLIKAPYLGKLMYDMENKELNHFVARLQSIAEMAAQLHTYQITHYGIKVWHQ